MTIYVCIRIKIYKYEFFQRRKDNKSQLLSSMLIIYLHNVIENEIIEYIFVNVIL